MDYEYGGWKERLGSISRLSRTQMDGRLIAWRKMCSLDGKRVMDDE